MNILQRQFETFITRNPHVYVLFEQFTFEAIDAGFDQYSSKAIVERIRWHTDIETEGSSFKISNNHTAYLARKFVEDHPEHAGFFRLNELRSAA